MVTRYAAWTFLFSGLMMVVEQLRFFPDTGDWFYVATFLTFLFVWTRLSFLFCKLAIDEEPLNGKNRIWMAVEQTRGNVWLLVRAVFIVLVPLLLFVGAYSFKIWDETVSDQAARLMGWRYGFMEAFLIMASYLPLTAVLAWVYAWAVPSTKQAVAEAFD